MLNDKVTTRSDLTKKIQAPIVGDINHLTSSQRKGIAVVGRDITGEQFRIIRANLSLLIHKKDRPVILVTSSGEGEGKSTVSTNLAAVLSLPGKKVALLEFDLRKPVISAQLDLENAKGLSDYIIGNTKNLDEICTSVPSFPSLHIFPSGDISTNPADLLLNPNLDSLFYELKQRYDYIIIDSAPIALVSDAFILAQYSDAELFVIRQRKTLKKQLDFLQDVLVTKRMNNVGLIFNDIKTGGKTGYYGYAGTSDKNYENSGLINKQKQKRKELFKMN